MKPWTIFCVIGTRPEAIKMAPIVKMLKKCAWSNTIVVSTGQHRELTRQIFNSFDIGIDVDLDVMEHNQTLASLTSRVIERSTKIMDEMKPDLIIVQGDTTTVMAFAISAFYQSIPIAHVEAGLRTHDVRNPFPEELNRMIASIVADLHFAPTELSYNNLIRQGIKSSNVFITGNTVIDALLYMTANESAKPFNTNKKILVTAHRRENWGEGITNICKAVALIHHEFPDTNFVFPVHPNPKVRNVVFSMLSDLERVNLTEPLGYSALCSELKSSFLVLTDSGGIQEEAPALGKPVLVLREETERPEAVDAGVAKLVGTNVKRIFSEVSRLINDKDYYESMSVGASPYGDGKSSARIIKIIFDYLQGRRDLC